MDGSMSNTTPTDDQNCSKGEGEDNGKIDLHPIRWWFAASAFPMIAGTFGPMALAFSICSIVEPWRDSIPESTPTDEGYAIKDPRWFTVINAIQILISAISNLFLLLNMSHTMRFSLAQPLTIIGCYICSLTQIALCVTVRGPLKLSNNPPTQAFSQAFYYAIFSSSFHFLVASLMSLTLLGAELRKYEKRFQLTLSQRTLMLQVIALMVYLEAGAAAYAHVEQWKFVDALYFAIVTLLTVGLGNFPPKTHLGRSLLFPYALSGIIVLGMVIGSIRSLMLESGGARIGSMILEWERKRQLKKFSKDLNRLRPEIEEHEAEKSDMSANTDTPPDYERYKQEFSLLRRIQHRALLIRRYLSLLLYTITWLSIWFLGALIFRSTEVPQSWSYFDAMYFAYTSILTIGYGDFYPTSNSGKAFFVLWALIAVPMLTILVGSMSDAVIRFVNDGRRCGGLGAGFKAIPPGLLGESQRFEGDSHDPRLRSRRDGDLECGGEKDFCESKSRGTSCGNATAKFDARREVRADIQQYHCLLAEEMVKVMKDANSTLPRKYSFEEWAWFLKLIGEGRGDSLNGSQRERNAGPCDWMGSGWLVAGSGQAEAEWILKGLMRTLQRELREAARRGQA